MDGWDDRPERYSCSRVDRIGKRKAVGGPGAFRDRRYVTESQFVFGSPPCRLTRLEGGLRLLGADDPDPLRRLAPGSSNLSIPALAHGTSSNR
jgi:hypothetical protein